MMVAAISATTSPKTTVAEEARHRSRPRPPLLPSEKDNGLSASASAASAALSKRPKPKEISSRYMSTSSPSSSTSSSLAASRRFPSPLVSRFSTPLPKRSQSAARRGPSFPLPAAAPPPAAPSSAAAKVLWTSSRSLSVSFQGESFSLPISKVRPAPSTPSPPSTTSGRPTPDRRRPATPTRVKSNRGDLSENSKPVDHHRWPARIRQPNALSRSLDCTAVAKANGDGFLGSSIRSLQQLIADDGRRASLQPSKTAADLDTSSDAGSNPPADLSASDTESVSSGSNSGIYEFSGTPRGGRCGTQRGIGARARPWPDAGSRLRRLQEPSSPLARKLLLSKKIASDKLDSLTSSPCTVPASRALSSPLRGPVRQASPSKFLASGSPALLSSSPSRVMQRPTRMRNLAASSVSGLSPSILSFSADVRRGKMGESRIECAHLLRLLYNRHLQWRFVNARAEAALSIQRLTAEKNLYNAWEATSDLRDTVTVRKIQIQLLNQNWKLTNILKGQLFYLEEWALLDREHTNSLSGAIEALKASTLRLPVIGVARADFQKVKDAVGSAVDVMQALGSSICSLLSKVHDMNCLVAELTNVATQEQELLSQCRDLLSALAAIRVEEWSLRGHLLQLKQMTKLTQL